MGSSTSVRTRTLCRRAWWNHAVRVRWEWNQLLCPSSKNGFLIRASRLIEVICLSAVSLGLMMLIIPLVKDAFIGRILNQYLLLSVVGNLPGLSANWMCVRTPHFQYASLAVYSMFLPIVLKSLIVYTATLKEHVTFILLYFTMHCIWRDWQQFLPWT